MLTFIRNNILKNKTKMMLLIPLMGLFLYSSYMIADTLYDYYKSEKLYESLRKNNGKIGSIDYVSNEIFIDEHSKQRVGVFISALEMDDMDNVLFEEKERKIAAEKAAEEERRWLNTNVFDESPELKTLNKDIVSWIRIPKTNIDYPIVQAKDNEYYLRRDLTKKHNRAGCLFMDYRNNNNYRNINTIIYGHNMRNNSMFQNLMLFKDRTFFNTNRFVYTYTPKGIQKWEVFSIFVTDIDFNYLINEFETDEDFNEFIGTVKSKSRNKRNVKLSRKDKILTLSTCSYEFEGARTVVMARLVK